MIRRVVSRDELAVNPHLLWNSFVNLLAMEVYDDLTAEQRAAHLVFLYESEVQNGGHLQFFENHGTGLLDETISALGALGAPEHQKLPRYAGDQYTARQRPVITTAEEYSEVALEDEFGEFDRSFDKARPPLTTCLEIHLLRHTSTFIEMTP